MPAATVPEKPATPAAGAAPACNLIGGKWVEGRGQTTRRIANPADSGEVLALVREPSPEQVDEACAAAARAFPAWRATPAPDRTRVLFRFRELLPEHPLTFP